MGHQLNISKCELISGADHQVSNATLRSFAPVSIRCFLVRPLTRLGPLDVRSSAEQLIDLNALTGCSLLFCYVFLLARPVFIIFFVVPHPLISHPALLTFDELLRSAVSLISNSILSDDQWLQAFLPIEDDGVGIRRVSSLATPAFLASAVSTLPLQSRILASCTFISDSALQACLSSWSQYFGPPPDPLLSKQSFHDRPDISSHAN